jgi:hypothetical protein
MSCGDHNKHSTIMCFDIRLKILTHVCVAAESSINFGVGVKRGNGTERTGGSGMAEPEKRKRKKGKTPKRG